MTINAADSQTCAKTHDVFEVKDFVMEAMKNLPQLKEKLLLKSSLFSIFNEFTKLQLDLFRFGRGVVYLEHCLLLCKLVKHFFILLFGLPGSKGNMLL